MLSSNSWASNCIQKAAWKQKCLSGRVTELKRIHKDPLLPVTPEHGPCIFNLLPQTQPASAELCRNQEPLLYPEAVRWWYLGFCGSWKKWLATFFFCARQCFPMVPAEVLRKKSLSKIKIKKWWQGALPCKGKKARLRLTSEYHPDFSSDGLHGLQLAKAIWAVKSWARHIL